MRHRRPFARCSRILGAALVSLALAGAVGAAPASAPAADTLPANVERLGERDGAVQYRLRSNGMTILLVEDRTAPVFSFLVVYHVGSRDEAPGNTGSAHLLEHLLFNKSTENFGRARGHRSFQEVLFEAGADFGSTNMTTWYDRMTGYSTLPSGELDLAMRIEADRLRRGLLLEEERTTEMTVVRNEMEIGENNPATALYKAVVGTAIQAHPYHWSTIGYRADVEGVSIATLRRHYDTFFWPDNAAAILVGDFDRTAALQLFDREFGGFPRAPQPVPQVITEEPPQEGERRVTVKRPGTVSLVLAAFLRPGALHEDFLPLDVLATALGDGVSSRLYQALVETGLATTASASNLTLRDPFPLLLSATVAPGRGHQEVETGLRAALATIAREGIDAAELARAKRQLEVSVVRSRDGAYPYASSLGEAVASASWTWFYDYLDRLAAVTAADVQRVAATYLVPDRLTVGWYVPVDPAAAPAKLPAAQRVAESFPATAAVVASAAGPAPSVGTRDSGEVATAAAAGDVDRTAAVPASEAPVPSRPSGGDTDHAGPGFAARTVRRVLANGIVLDVLPSRAVPTFSVEGVLLAGDAVAPPRQPNVPELTARMVQRGTTKRAKLELARVLEGAGLGLALRNDVTEVTITGSGHARDLGTFLEVLAEELISPAFPPDELVKAKAELRNEILRLSENTGYRAGVRLNRLSLPEGHPYRQVEPEELLASLDAVTADDLRRFHAERYAGASLILAIVGDVDPEAVAADVERLFASLPRGERPALASPPPVAAVPARAVVALPGKANMSLLLGHASGLRREDPDYEAALLANAAFGQSGLSSRLGARVRDREGLSYSLVSRFLEADLADGTWMINVNLAPSNLEPALRSTLDELGRYVREGMTAEELRVNQSFFAGNFKVRLGSTAGIAAALATAEKFGYGPAYLDEFPQRIGRVTLAEANAALRRRIRPETLHVVVAGDLERLPPAVEGLLPTAAGASTPPVAPPLAGAFEHFFARPAGAALPAPAAAANEPPQAKKAPPSGAGGVDVEVAEPERAAGSASAADAAEAPCPEAGKGSAFRHFFGRRRGDPPPAAAAPCGEASENDPPAVEPPAAARPTG